MRKEPIHWQFHNIFYLTCLLLMFFLLNQCSNSSMTPIAQRGVIDISTWNFEKDGMVPLVGEWEFYWNEMIENSKDRNNFLKNY